MNQQYFILYTEFVEHKHNIAKMSKLTEHDIMDVWIESDEDPVKDLSKIVYSYDAPLYQKMIWRFRQTKSPTLLHNEIDPCNRKILLRYFDLDHWNLYNKFNNRLLEFFVWLKSQHFSQEDFTDQEKADKHLRDWKENEMVFFINLLECDQQRLINKYNEYYRNFKIEW